VLLNALYVVLALFAAESSSELAVTLSVPAFSLSVLADSATSVC